MEKLIIGLITFFSFIFSENLEFIVKFMGINSAKVNICIKDTVFDGINSKIIDYKTYTIPPAKYIYPIDNYYRTIINNKFTKILYFSKNTSQPHLQNMIRTNLKNNIVKYENSNIEIQNNYHNIFTLLQYLNHISINQLINKNILIDREGIKYYSNFIITNSNNEFIEIELKLNPINEIQNHPVINNTDIFTWAIFKEDSKKLLRIDKLTNNLIYCEFSSGFINMKANLINK